MSNFAPGTQILYYDGTVKSVEDVKVGDVLMGDDNTPRNVLELYHNKEEMYEIIPNKGDKYMVSRSHHLILVCTGHNDIKKGTKVIISMNDYLNKSKTWKIRFKLFRSLGIEWKTKEVEIEPYLLGLWLGDGTSKEPEITNIDEEILIYCKEYAETNNLRFIAKGSSITYRFSAKPTYKNVLLNSLRKYNLLGNKHIPFEYKITSRENRLQLLAGIIDTDGCINMKGYDIILKIENLIDDIVFISRSLGFSAYKKKCNKSCMYKGEKRVGTYYRCMIYGKGVEEIPCKIIRKQINDNSTRNKDNLVSGFSVNNVGEKEYYSLRINEDKPFLLESFDVVK
jgi:hypothetical protein